MDLCRTSLYKGGCTAWPLSINILVLYWFRSGPLEPWTRGQIWEKSITWWAGDVHHCTHDVLSRHVCADILLHSLTYDAGQLLWQPRAHIYIPRRGVTQRWYENLQSRGGQYFLNTVVATLDTSDLDLHGHLTTELGTFKPTDFKNTHRAWNWYSTNIATCFLAALWVPLFQIQPLGPNYSFL